MKVPTRLFKLPLTFAFGLALLAPAAVRASYHEYNIVNGSDCIIQDYRSANIPPGVYDAIHEDNATSSDGGTAYFYGGMTHQNNVNGNLSTLVQYSMWPASGVYGPYVLQIPTFAGTNMTWWASTAEGSASSIKGYWPQFTTNLWSRFVVRYWAPGNGTAHQGYQGMWMKDPSTGNWYHLGTIFYPFAATGVTGMNGWQEDFTGYTGIYTADYANGYYHYNGSWSSANQIYFTPEGPSDCYLINNGTAAESQVANTNLTANAPITLTLTNQPALPTFDPIVVTNYGASTLGSQVLVQWQLPLTSSPQLSYKVEIFNNSNYTGSASFTAFDNDPETRQVLLDTPGVATPYVRLTIADIFYNTNAPILITPATATLSSATNVTGTVTGLAFQYYQSTTNWTVLPNFSSLTPALTGAVGFPDPTPREQRINYGFNYTGYLSVPTNGLYAFKLNSGDGSKLIIDGTTVISFDGLHDSTQFKSGGIALAAGRHTFNLPFFKGAANPVNTTAYTDGLGLTYQGPGMPAVEVPDSAYSRVPGGSEPTITISMPGNGATVLNGSPGFLPTVTANGNPINSVQYFLTDYSYYYFSANPLVDYYLGQNSVAPYGLNTMMWTAPTNAIRARLVYNGTNILDSAPVVFASTNSATGSWTWTPLDLHDYPSGADLSANSLTLAGNNMNLLSRQVIGDCTLIGHLAGMTPNVAAPDGLTPDNNWRAGIILRSTTNDTTSQPLGDGNPTRFTALFSSVGGGSYYEDDTMRDGNGDANAWSANQGNGNGWFKIQRTGNTFISYVSADGVNWNYANSNTLANFSPSNYIYAGVFAYALPEPNPNIYSANFDYFSLTGTNVTGPASLLVSPATNAVVDGLPATFSAAMIGPIPAGYQWQLNGTNIAGATNASYTVASATPANAGNYTVYASGVTSAPAVLVISFPAGSGVWTNPAGGSWTTAGNWSGGTIASGVSAVADFSTLSLSGNETVTLDGSNTVGTLLFDDLNGTAQHNWTLSTGTGGPLTLAVSSGSPAIAVQHATNIISAVLAGTQGFTKSGAGYLTLNGSSTITGTLTVGAGALEMVNKSGDTPYVVDTGATLKIGYSTGGGYANTALTVNGSGTASAAGLYLAGGINYNTAGTITLTTRPTAIRTYGSGTASLSTFDVNSGQGLYCTANASGSTVASTIQMINGGYGMIGDVDPGTNTANGDLTLNGPLNVGNLGFYKRGNGSLLLNGVATSGNIAVQIQAGSVLCGITNCLGVNAAVPVSSGGTLALNGLNETAASLSLASGGSVVFGGTNVFTVTNATLGGTLVFGLNKGGSPASSKLTVTGSALTYAGTLSAVSLSTNIYAAGDTFTLFSASSYAGTFTNMNLPVLPVGLYWSTNNLAVNGTLTVATNGLSVWNGAGANSYWNTAANWTGGTPTNWQLLVFQGTARQANTNNLLGNVGRATFTNGGFALAGNPVSLLWGLVNGAGTNNWGIPTTLTATQSFSSSNGVLIVSGPVTNSGYALTLDGAGSNSLAAAVTGTGALVKTGAGSAAISAQQTYTGGTVVNGGTLALSYNSGAGGTLQGVLTVNSNATAVTTVGNALGYSGADWVQTINLNFGTLNTAIAGSDNGWGTTINLTGGTLGSTVANGYFSMGDGPVFNVTGTNVSSVISANLTVRDASPGGIVFNVSRGTAATDLNITGKLLTAGSGGITLNGSGILQVSGVNTYTGATIVNGGTLLVGGSLASGSAVTVATGGTLGGTGTVNGPATVSAGGTIAPGTAGIGTLTVSNTLTLAGNALMKISKNGGVLSNDVAFASGALTIGGSLTVTNIGTNAFASGDHFTLFPAGSYAGVFTNLTLPPLPAGLAWYTNNLAVTGSLFVSNTVVTLTYNAGANGGISGTSPQTVNYGGNGTAVTPVPNTGFHFVNWSDGSVANPRTDTGVTSNLTVTANFAINTYTLTYTAGANGSISGTSPQTVNYGASGTAVTAVANSGYHFVNWSDGSTANPRTDTNVTANVTVTANFSSSNVTLTYLAGANGSIGGTTPQTVAYGGSGTAVTALPVSGYAFTNWSDGSTADPRTDNNVTNNITVTANFVASTNGPLVWDGGDTTGNWSAPANWNWAVPANGQALTFQGTLQPANTNDFLTAVGQIVFASGGFTLAGNPVTLQGGLLNVTNNSTLSISTTLGGAQSFVSSNGTLTVSGAVTNAGYTLTLDGPASNVVSGAISGSGAVVKNGTGTAVLSGASSFTNTVTVNAGTLQVTGKTADSAYSVVQGATLQIGYSTGGAYASTALTINGNGTAATTGFYLAGGVNYNSSGEITLQTAPTTIRQYGTGLASLGTFDINLVGLHCTAAASGSAIDPNIQLVSDGYGMTIQADAGANTATGDVIVNGPLNVGVLGFYKEGAGSLVLNGVAAAGNAAVQVTAGTLICGITNCLGVNASVPVSSGATLLLNGLNQTVSSLNAAAGSTVNFAGTGTLTVSNPPVLAGTVDMVLNPGTVTGSALVIQSGTLTNGGTLVVTTVGTNALVAGDSFVLFNAPAYAGGFTNITLPTLATGLQWTNNVNGNGTISVGYVTETLTYNAGANGSISGTSPQTVNYGANGTAVTPVPNTGYHFVNWSDGSVANPRTDTVVTSNLTVTANFAINTYTLTYNAGANGSISGTTPQTVNYGASGTAVTAVANSGYSFTTWSDGSSVNPRTDSSVTSNITVTASFAANTTNYTTLLLAQSPNSYWRLGETNGASTLADASGNGHSAVPQGAGLVLGVAGPQSPAYPLFETTNTAAQFNGASNWISAGTAASLNGTGDFTLSAWVKTTAATNGVILQQRDATNFVGEYQLAVNPNGTVAFFVYGSGGYQFNFATTRAVNDGQWHTIMAERSGGTNGYIFIDGALAAATNGTAEALANNLVTYVGRDVRNLNENFNGQIDEVAIFNQALATNVVAQLSNTNRYLLPTPWSSNVVGTVASETTATYFSKAFTVEGAGAGLATNKDNFQFVYMPLTNSLTITAQVGSLQTNGTAPLAGVMVRSGTTNGSVFAFMGLTATNSAKWIYRTKTNAVSSITTFTNMPLPYWVRLVRATNTFTGYVSSNGTAWVQSASVTLTNLTTNALVGLVVSSGVSNVTDTAVFNSVTVTNGGVLVYQPLLVPQLAPPAYAELDSLTVSYGTANFTISGDEGSVWQIEESDDLVNWTPVETVTLIGGSVSQTQSDDMQPARFYRLVQVR